MSPRVSPDLFDGLFSILATFRAPALHKGRVDVGFSTIEGLQDALLDLRDASARITELEGALAEAEEAMGEVIGNASCSCWDTESAPCARCNVAFGEAREAIINIASTLRGKPL